MEKFQISQDTTIEQVALKVKDLDKQLDFYTRVLKFDILGEENGMAFLGSKASGKTFLILLEEPEALASPDIHNGLNHIGLTVPTRERLSAVLNHIEAVDYPVLELLDYGYAEVIVLKDPEYNVIKIYWDREIATGNFTQENMPIDEDELRNLTTETFDALTDGEDLGHVQLNVGDIKKSENFYRDILGLKLRDVNYRSVSYLSASDYHHHVSLRHKAIVAEEGLDDEHVGLDYIVFSMQSTKDLLAFKAHLDEKKVSYYYDNKEIIHLDDPNGIHIWFRVL